MSDFGEALARYRNEAGLNQRQLAAAIGLDSTQVNKIERGHRPPLDAKYMKPLVRALRLSRSEALDLVQKADLSPKVLDFMDEVQAPMYPRILREDATKSKLVKGNDEVAPCGLQPAIAGALGAGVGLDKMLPRAQPFGSLIEQTLDEFQLTPKKKRLAEQLIAENARLVCQILADERERR